MKQKPFVQLHVFFFGPPGGVRSDMYRDLPRPLTSKSGFQGCFSSFETNGELIDPVKHALVPSTLVEEGCEESVAFEWPSLKQPGVVRYEYPPDKRPDTSADMLSLGFITPSIDAVLARVDGHPMEAASGGGGGNGAGGAGGMATEKKDFLEIQIVSVKLMPPNHLVNLVMGCSKVVFFPLFQHLPWRTNAM